MLLKTCKTCNGFGQVEKDFTNMVDCSECSDGYIVASEDEKVYVNVYLVTRELCGREEGGWYHNCYNCIETVPCKNKYSDEIVEDLKKEHEHRQHGNIYSVLGGTALEVLVEENMKESETKEKPRYE